MRTRIKTQKEILQKQYLFASEIEILFALPKNQAAKVFAKANEIDNEELKDFRLYDNKVRLTSCLKLLKISWEQLVTKVNLNES